MLRTILFALPLALPATLVLADDQAFQAEYLAAAQTFTLPGTHSLSQMDLLAADPIAGLLPQLEGDWAQVDNLYPNPHVMRGDLISLYCERSPITLTQTEPHGFEMREVRTLEGVTASMSVRYDFLFGNSFDRSVREEEAVVYLELDEAEVSVGHLALARLRGQVLLFHPSPNILVLASPLSPLQIYARCPGTE